MQTYRIMTKCGRCGVLLAGREQFMRHMIHGHDIPFEQADATWKSIQAATHNTH